jgi:hypothetical protein
MSTLKALLALAFSDTGNSVFARSAPRYGVFWSAKSRKSETGGS